MSSIEKRGATTFSATTPNITTATSSILQAVEVPDANKVPVEKARGTVARLERITKTGPRLIATLA